ncbi:MAG: hypothetical protein COW48_02405 [Hydrogenophilales bacterium CG17_big_fil_post_rev_8_21_14_2_50_63_12]|nr:MAG: hypothetical protein COW48_02405 [Hydrogenophilales bacterium CG17_big_fil_post_rev_8_21_14_2_50_63_12]PIX96352.1 MAG: hypothetical protein COZ24_11000 [Hydrogenophilales bacterium CG_4_10_14_3_um_filter_63_21]PJB03130.1 MAG: hypothetical protein CO126_08335 [Hydrogenophilales bacterium CG_4_9_14_3_um_filter_63_34]
MTRTTLFTSLIAAGLLATSPTFAGPWDGNLDLQGSILNDLDKPAFVGTGLAQASRIDAYNGAFAGNADLDQTHFATGHAGPEKGYGDTYGWAVLDVGR